MSKQQTVRKSRRLAAKRKARRANKRMSVGDALGLSPRKPKGRNLREAAAVDAAVAAAASHTAKGSRKSSKKDKREAARRRESQPT